MVNPVTTAEDVAAAFARFGPAYMRWSSRRAPGEPGPAARRLLSELRAGPRATGELARLLGISPSRATALLDRLVAMRLVIRRRTHGDGRKRVVALTKLAQTLDPVHLAAHTAAAATVFSILSAADRTHLVRVLDRLLAAMDDGA